MSATKFILVINPNSSESVTDGLRETLQPPPGCPLVFYTAPSHAPPSINDVTTAALTASACWEDIRDKGLLDLYDAFLVCCCAFVHPSLLSSSDVFKTDCILSDLDVGVGTTVSDHPLTHILREQSTKPIIGILESAITTALLSTRRFGILTTGTGFKFLRSQDVYSFMGGNSVRYAGLVTTGLGVVELREGDRDKVEKNMKEGAGRLAGMGADAVLLGCAGECFFFYHSCGVVWIGGVIDQALVVVGMAGMESLVQQGVKEAGHAPVRIIDGARAGVEFLASLLRLA